MPTQPEKTLVIMDMLPVHTRCVFLPTRISLLNAVVQEIKQARLEQTPIIVQGLADDTVADYLNETDCAITDALAGYIYKCYLDRTSNDSSLQILNACGTLCAPTKRIQLCGLFTNLCIRDTAVGLARLSPGSTIEVLREACSSTNPHEETYDSFWNRFSEPNIDIIPAPVTLPISVTDRPLRFVARARDLMGRNYDEPIAL